MRFAELRRQYHQQICQTLLRVDNGVPNIADRASRASKEIALSLYALLGGAGTGLISSQTLGAQFEQITRDYLQAAFALLAHLRPGEWTFSVSTDIERFEQYKHLAELKTVLSKNPELAATFGVDYLVTPDIVVARHPVTDTEINRIEQIIDPEADSVARHTSLRAANQNQLLLHASISCKWTIRSDRSQNVRTEALNLVRNRKGHSPHIVVVTAEPLPTRIASVALGTGDLDHVYHFALEELKQSVAMVDSDSQQDMLNTLINGNRLRDISDLPFDLAV
ncbi:MAG: restriction endonuclease [Anaerolineae bacterium]|nr:restriction endonuclease [Anaerolineae bacterium]